MSRVAIVTGSNKGLGLAIVEGLCRRFAGVVYLTARNEARGRRAVEELRERGLSPAFHVLDVANRRSVEAFRDHLRAAHGGVDLLVNNAAIVEDQEAGPASYETSRRVIDVNYGGLVNMQELIYPLVRAGGRILNISSDCGHLSNVQCERWIERLSRPDLGRADVDEFVQWFLEAKRTGTFRAEEWADGATVVAYRASKVAVSALTVVQQRELAARGVRVASLHPGLVRTDMTGGVGFLSAAEAAETPLRLLLEEPPPPAAYVWYDGRVLDWYDHKADYYFKYSTLER
ncbi:carbonyl reductase [NADPH] 1-like [Aricia agestis]|uniref:carbonyl reductase [NADPH] 1-like n=1 Tax=Aricia agestis TaxID=91739 RepID=UPI001C206CD3|nr:carbonyl reductase [NADPH] 1-like [Aricia agestis]